MTVMGVLASMSARFDSRHGPRYRTAGRRHHGAAPAPARQNILSLPFILRAYFVHGSLLALSCYATYYYMGCVLGAWHAGQSLTALPASPRGLQFARATPAYLQTLTAYFCRL